MINSQGGEPLNPRGSGASIKVVRNSVIYFASLGIAAAAALFLVPVTVHALGPSRFGLLALAWAVAEGIGMFDFGLGRATVRFVADATEKGAVRRQEIILASAWFQTAVGLLAGLVLYAIAPVLVDKLFKIDPPHRLEALAMFRVLALHVPVLLCLAALRSSLEGAQRFGLSAMLRVPSSLASVAVPAVAAAMGASLSDIMWMLFAVRLVLAIASGFVVGYALLPSGWKMPAGLSTIREMLSYSGWVAISAALGPALGSFDRFVVGSIAGVAALGYYSGAAEAATRFFLIPVTAFTALLPALAYSDARGERTAGLTATRSARRQLATLFFPVCLALFMFARPIIGKWLGPEFEAVSGDALAIMAIGIFTGGLAHLPLAHLYGAGRPDIPAKFHIIEVALYLPLTFLLVSRWGITGAAAAWTARCTADLLFYEISGRSALGSAAWTSEEISRTSWFVGTGTGLFVAFALSRSAWTRSDPAAIVLAVLALAAYAFVAWRKVFSPSERRAWVSLIPVGQRLPA